MKQIKILTPCVNGVTLTFHKAGEIIKVDDMTVAGFTPEYIEVLDAVPEEKPVKRKSTKK